MAVTRMVEIPNETARSRFETVYDSCVIGAGFVEADEYYRLEKERYWRSFILLHQLDLGIKARVLEIGGGQLAVLLKKMFDQDCTVADISPQFIAPLQRAGVEFFEYNLHDRPPPEREEMFDVVILLEVIEHIPVPAHVVFERIKLFLKPSGVLFLTTPNLFRMRNLVRMILGKEFLDHFQTANPKQGLGHQLEYSAEHLRWQIERADMEVIMLKHDELGHIGHSMGARVGRHLMGPLGHLRPVWRDGLVAAARKK